MDQGLPVTDLLPAGWKVSDAPAAEYRRCAFIHAMRILGQPEEAEEIANDVILKFLELGKFPASNEPPFKIMKRPVIDAIRARRGRKGTNRAEHTALERYAHSIDEKPDNDYALVERLASQTADQQDEELRIAAFIERIIQKQLAPIPRAILLLELKWGLNDAELAWCFGYSPTWVMTLKRLAFQSEQGVLPTTIAAPSNAAKEIARLQARVQELEDTPNAREARLKERIRHLEIILEAKGIAHNT